MPIYEFRCQTCDHEFEILVRNGERPNCPKCPSPNVERLLSASVARSRGSLPVTSCPPPETGPCGPGCCRLPG